MALAWAVQQRTGNSGWVDTVWTFGLGAIGIAAALWPDPAAASGRQWLIAVLIAAWALRLGGHIAHRSSGIADDPRYAQLIKGWGADASRQMFILLQKQAVVSIPLVMTVFLAAHNPEQLWCALDVAAVLLFAVAAAGEALADHQLRGFRSRHAQRTAVCDEGLWAWSRHPNYFFEWLMWVAFALLAIGSTPFGWLALAGPLAIYWLLTQVSGIPPLEEHMLRTRGEAFRRYQARTSAFFPLPPRRAAATGTRS
ncbi:MAG: DUF1295 domain-containing protein [Hyphomicrobiaceae bacterium]|nr:DUF1295 domain-containing protein [Hyphomicrobiaceae bacterium]